MNHEITVKKPLLDENGHLTEAGFARKLILDYDRKAIKANSLRIKEWDYYFIGNEKYGVCLTIADNSYMGLDSVTLIEFGDNPWEQTTSPMSIMTRGKRNFPPTSEKGDVEVYAKNYFISFRNPGPDENGVTKRTLMFKMDKFKDGKSISGEIVLTEEPGDSIVVATPFEGNDKAFYYNQKINNMRASGIVSFDGKEYRFDPEDSFAVLDWGRGVWTYKNTWYWGSASGLCNGKPFGFNIGYGFGCNPSTENMLFVDGKGHKLSQVTFNIPKNEDGSDDFMSPWTFTSDDGRFEMDFTPVINRSSHTDVKLIRSLQDQVFGYYTGKVVLDDGEIIELDRFFGFAEKVQNKW
ncbi:MAG: DUF2804 domain-containing protein [Firmicutes bacterium]|nr:DUF2804 domain-containing protein [Bacillota bacterium]